MPNNSNYNFPVSCYLNISFDSDQKDLYQQSEVNISKETPKRIKGRTNYSSPIFMISDENKINLNDDYIISFCYTDNPLKFIQFIKSKKLNEITSFFSTDLASVIIISNPNFDLLEFLLDYFIL